MEKIDRSATNWNAVQLRVCLEPGQENLPVGQRTATVERHFGDGSYSFDEARDIVEQLLRVHLRETPDLAEETIRLWRETPDSVEFALPPLGWALFQHGEDPRTGVEAVMKRLLLSHW